MTVNGSCKIVEQHIKFAIKIYAQDKLHKCM